MVEALVPCLLCEEDGGGRIRLREKELSNGIWSVGNCRRKRRQIQRGVEED